MVRVVVRARAVEGYWAKTNRWASTYWAGPQVFGLQAGSIDQLNSTWYAAEFGKSSWKIVKGVMVVARDIKFGTLYTTKE